MTHVKEGQSAGELIFKDDVDVCKLIANKSDLEMDIQKERGSRSNSNSQSTQATIHEGGESCSEYGEGRSPGDKEVIDKAKPSFKPKRTGNYRTRTNLSPELESYEIGEHVSDN